MFSISVHKFFQTLIVKKQELCISLRVTLIFRSSCVRARTAIASLKLHGKFMEGGSMGGKWWNEWGDGGHLWWLCQALLAMMPAVTRAPLKQRGRKEVIITRVRFVEKVWDDRVLFNTGFVLAMCFWVTLLRTHAILRLLCVFGRVWASIGCIWWLDKLISQLIDWVLSNCMCVLETCEVIAMFG